MLKRSYVVVLAVLAVGLGLMVSGCTDTTTDNSIVSEDSVMPDGVQEDSSAISDSPDDGMTEVTDQEPQEEVNNPDDTVYVVASEGDELTDDVVTEEETTEVSGSEEEDLTDVVTEEDISDVSGSEEEEDLTDDVVTEEDISDVSGSEEELTNV